MIAEKTNTAEQVTSVLSAKNGKVGFMNDEALSAALYHLQSKGFPSNRHEDYKYCNLDAVLKKEFKQLSQQLNEVKELKDLKLKDAMTLVVVNGNYSESLSDKIVLKGLHICSFTSLDAKEKTALASQADPASDAFIALNTAFSGNGFYLKVEKNAVIAAPLHVFYINSSAEQALVNPRNWIELEENSELTLVEHFIHTGEGKVFDNFLSEKLVHENARLLTYTLQDEGERAYGVYTNQVKVQRYGHYNNLTLTLSGQVVRNNHNVVLEGEFSEAHLNGLFMTSASQLVDNHTLVDHRVPNCQSNELYKGVVDGKSSGIFNGKIFVRKDAQKTNAYQSSKNILLSDDATINTKPQLEIYANDVKCSHGTSTGKIDEEAIFYLGARGIGRQTAMRMLLNAFAGELTAKIELEALREIVENRLGFE